MFNWITRLFLNVRNNLKRISSHFILIIFSEVGPYFGFNLRLNKKSTNENTRKLKHYVNNDK